MINHVTIVWAAMLGAAASFSTLAGPEWIEGEFGTGDAGSQTGSAQVPGRDPLGSVRGATAAPAVAGSGAAGDFEDLYLIQIVDPVGFSAQTVLTNGGVDFNTQLWLFDVNGFGLLANDDAGGDTRGLPFFSLITPISNDGSGAQIPSPGLYFLGISGFNNDPSSANRDVFFQAAPNEISGPDGPGGGSPLNEWAGGGQTGDYRIVLSGAASAIVDQCPEDVNDDGVVDVNDLNQILGNFGPCPPGDLCAEDVNGDLLVDLQDVIQVQTSFGPCPAQCGDPFAGPCFGPHPGPACDNAVCCAFICFSDPFCCEVEWDLDCAIAASMQCPQTPVNDQCSDRFDIVEGVTAFSTIGATTDGPAHPSACNFFGEPQIGSDIWFNYVATCTGTLTIDTCSSDTDFDTELAVYDGCACPVDDDGLLACSDDACDLQSLVELLVVAGQCYKIRLGGFNGAQGDGELTVTCEPDVGEALFDTGPHRLVIFNGELTNLGFSNGNLSNAQPQRWNAERFTLPPLPEGFDAWLITEIRPEGFIPVPPPPVLTETLHWRIWSHAGDLIAPTPADELASGFVPLPTPVGDVFPIEIVGLQLAPGEYWLNVHGGNGTGGLTPSNFAWFCNPDGGIALIDPDGGPVPPGPFHWRSAMYPVPGFVQEAPPQVVQQPGLDPNDRYKKAFAILGVPISFGSPCDGAVGDCCVAHPGTGCDDPRCCEAVCAADPFCCDVSWDGICAGAAQEVCGICPTGCQGFCGGQAPDGCFCDDACCVFNDCCADVATFCTACADCNRNGLPDAFEIANGLAEDANGNGVPDECECLVNRKCPGDVTGEGDVNGADLGQLLLDWNTDGCPAVAGGTAFSTNLDGVGVVNGSDLGQLLLNWGEPGCP